MLLVVRQPLMQLLELLLVFCFVRSIVWTELAWATKSQVAPAFGEQYLIVSPLVLRHTVLSRTDLHVASFVAMQVE